MSRCNQRCMRQSGVILIFALIILLVLGLIASTTLELLSRQQQIVSNHQLAMQQKQLAKNALLLCEQQLEASFSRYRFHQQELPANILLREQNAGASDAGAFLIDWQDESLWAQYASSADISMGNKLHNISAAECLFVLVSTPFSANQMELNLMADAESGARTRRSGQYHFRVFARLLSSDKQVPSLLASDYIIFHPG